MELCACMFKQEVIKAKQYMSSPINNMVLMMKTHEFDGNSCICNMTLMTTTYKDKKVLKLFQAVKDAQDS